MRLWLILTLLTALFIPLIGCGDGMAYSRRERMHRMEVIFEKDMKMLADDWDMIMLNDRSPRFSYWATE
jgi:hypothetical protein